MMMNSNKAIGQMTTQSCDVEGYRESPTLSQNIDDRIKHLQEQVERLTRVKQLLGEPAGLLNVPIDDLRFAMNY